MDMCPLGLIHVVFFLKIKLKTSTLVTQQPLKNVFKTFQNGWILVEMWGFLKVVCGVFLPLENSCFSFNLFTTFTQLLIMVQRVNVSEQLVNSIFS